MAQFSVTRSPGTVANDSSVGDVAWSNPSNATTEDGSNATCSLNAAQTSQYINATNFGFTIPTGAVIKGVEATFKAQSSVLSTTKEQSVTLMKAGSRAGSALDFGLVSWLTSLASKIAGTATSLWGTTITASEVNASNFGVSFRAQNAGVLTASAQLDSITMTVHYDLPVIHSMFGGGVIGQ